MQGYRICFTSVHQMNTFLQKDSAPDVLHSSQAPQTDRKTFLELWIGEKKRAVRDQLVLVVVGGSYYERDCHKEWLQSIEEEEWFDNDVGLMRARFTTLSKMFQAIYSNTSLPDGWGDIIENTSVDIASASDDERTLTKVVPMAVAIIGYDLRNCCL